MKAFTFEAFGNSKSYGDITAPASIVVVKGAASKSEARDVASKHIANLRIVNGGRAHTSEQAAVDHSESRISLYNRTKKPGVADTTLVVIDIRMQRDLARLVGL